MFETFEEWLRHSWSQGWITAPVCYIHDGLPTSEQEEGDMEDGGDPCIHILRLLENDIHKRQVEKNFSPATVRASNRGW